LAIRRYKPTSPGRRVSSAADKSELTDKKPEKTLLAKNQKNGGRNFQGKITARHIGGGAKRLYRVIDFKRDKDNVPARVAAIEYDPNRSARIALLHYADGEKRYIIAPDGIKAGAEVISGEKVEPNVGNSMPLTGMPIGTTIHNVELTPGRGGKFARSAGTSVVLSAREGKYAYLIMRSGEIRRVPAACRATVGKVGNPDHSLVRLGKAGRKRHLGRRPHVRGTAMNPVAHPMGGGEGRTGGGRHPCSPTGKLSKGAKTRKKRAITNVFIVRRRRNKRR
jgi:large subunit ribosomal protein L2